MPTDCVYRFISCRQNRKPIPTYVGTVPETNLLLFLPESIFPPKVWGDTKTLLKPADCPV
jgi:hypothetical protein